MNVAQHQILSFLKTLSCCCYFILEDNSNDQFSNVSPIGDKVPGIVTVKRSPIITNTYQGLHKVVDTLSLFYNSLYRRCLNSETEIQGFGQERSTFTYI